MGSEVGVSCVEVFSISQESAYFVLVWRRRREQNAREDKKCLLMHV